MKIVFMGTPDFSVPVLENLIEYHDVVCVYTQPPRPKGRGKKLQKSPVHICGEKNNIKVRTPLNFKDEKDINDFKKLDADISVVCAYGLILPVEILEAFSHQAINVHASLLPRWRGAAPIQRSIMAGDEYSGVTIMNMVKALDAGQMILKEKVKITDKMNAKDLHDKLSLVGADLILKALDDIENKTVKYEKQDENKVTYAKKIDKSEAKIDWSKTAQEISLKIRGLSPFPGCWFEHNNNRIKILQAKPIECSEKKDYGIVCDDELTISCGNGAIRVEKLQKAGKSPSDVESFLRGYEIAKGEKLL